MKNIKLLLPLLSLFSLVLASPALAIEPISTIKQVKNEAKTEIKEIKSSEKEQIKTIKTEQKEIRTTKLDTLKQKRAESIYKAIRNELIKRFDVLSKTKIKITTRITEKETASKDMTAAKAKLAEFSKYETAYNTDLAAFDAKFIDITTAKPSVLVADLKTISTKIRSDLNSMRQVLVDTLKLVVKAK